jgi:hypothetical protein
MEEKHIEHPFNIAESAGDAEKSWDRRLERTDGALVIFQGS